MCANACAIVYDRAMDPLAGLLDGPRARGAFLLRSVMRPPWSLRVIAESPLTVLAVASGVVWIVPDEGEDVRLEAGDVAITHGSGHYTVADDPSTSPQIIIHPGQRCVSMRGEPLEEPLSLGVRTWGNDPTGPTVMLVGAYEALSEISDRLVSALPPVLSLSSAEWECPLIPLLCDEIAKDDPGQEAVLDRLLDLLLVAALRAWFDRPDGAAPAWYRAQSDPVVGRTLRLMQANPAHPWTLAGLADEVGVSRAALARRFRDLVGEPPMSYLTEWRIALAADLLREPGATVGSVAPRVGYRSPFALSTAFKRVRGTSPQAHRALALA